MDALEFLKERKRMCKPYKGCKGCPLERGNCGLSTSRSDEEYERIICARTEHITPVLCYMPPRGELRGRWAINGSLPTYLIARTAAA